MNTDRDQWISCHCCHSYVCHSERSLLLCRPEDPDVPNTSSTGLQHPALNKTTYPFHQRARRIPYCYFSKYFISLFPLTKFFFFFLISCQQSKQTQHNAIILLQIINLSVGLQRKKGQKLALIWFIYYDSKCESNCFHAKLSALCFAVDAMQQNNAEKLFPKIRSIYVPNSVTHAVSDFWDEFNSIHLKRLNWRAKTKCLFKSYNNDKDFI